jgi:hypothetical protein
VRACLQTVLVSHGATFKAVHRRGSLVLCPRSGDHRFRSSNRARLGSCRRLVRRSDRDVGVCLRPASSMSAVDVRSLLIPSSTEIGHLRSFRSRRGLCGSVLGAARCWGCRTSLPGGSWIGNSSKRLLSGADETSSAALSALRADGTWVFMLFLDQDGRLLVACTGVRQTQPGMHGRTPADSPRQHAFQLWWLYRGPRTGPFTCVHVRPAV